MQTYSGKVHVISTYFLPVVAGLENGLRQTYFRLAKKGWKVTVYTTNRQPGSRTLLPRAENIDGIVVRRYSYFRFIFLPFLVGDWFKASHVVVADFITLPGVFIFLTTYIAKLCNIKKYFLILSSHGLFSMSAKTYPGIKMLVKTRVDRMFGIPLLNRSADIVHAVSETEKQNLVRAGANAQKIAVIYNGLDDFAFQENHTTVTEGAVKLIKSNTPYLLQIGRIDQVKNQSAIVKALPYLPAELKVLFVGPIGDAQYCATLQAEIKKLGFENRVVFVGVWHDMDKYTIIKEAFAMVHLSKTEGYPLVILEGLSQGTICIGSRGTAIEEIIHDGKNGFCISNTDPMELAKKLEFIKDPANAGAILQMRKAGQEFTRGKSWNHVTTQVETLFNSLVQS